LVATVTRPPIGWKWVELTSLTEAVPLLGGGFVCFPRAYLKRLPKTPDEPVWSYYEKVNAMRDDAEKKQGSEKWVMPAGEPFLEGLETIAQYCTDTWNETKKIPRQPCKLTIEFFSGSCMVSMNDQDKSRSTHTVGETVREALELLEGHLEKGTAPWRYWKKMGR
jgi:hypothetical protein